VLGVYGVRHTGSFPFAESSVVFHALADNILGTEEMKNPLNSYCLDASTEYSEHIARSEVLKFSGRNAPVEW
jgi:hypothetical protein